MLVWRCFYYKISTFPQDVEKVNNTLCIVEKDVEKGVEK